MFTTPAFTVSRRAGTRHVAAQFLPGPRNAPGSLTFTLGRRTHEESHGCCRQPGGRRGLGVHGRVQRVGGAVQGEAARPSRPSRPGWRTICPTRLRRSAARCATPRSRRSSRARSSPRSAVPGPSSTSARSRRRTRASTRPRTSTSSSRARRRTKSSSCWRSSGTPAPTTIRTRTPPPPARFDGPLHDQIPAPNRSVDNRTIWQADFSPAHYRQL
jgi:hypothetical protein